jgi:tRNA(Ile)-lysidine synthase
MISDALAMQGFRRIGVAVSGGGDSLALLHLLVQWAQQHDVRIFAVTVDHGLRDEAAAEAGFVGGICQRLGVPHETLEWREWRGHGNLQNAARTARYQLIGAWAQRHGLDAVALGHTLEDQAETVLMRLARGAGVDGLSAMQDQIERDGVIWVRPLLTVSRKALRIYLTRHEVTWIEDPSNEDPAFERVRMREAMSQLEPLGITPQRLSMVASNMSGAKDALSTQCEDALRRYARVDAGALVIDRAALETLPPEIMRRLIGRGVMWITGAAYPPRRAAVTGALNAAQLGRDATLEGCHLHQAKGKLWLFRELQAAPRSMPVGAGLWDKRWDVQGGGPGATVGVLGRNGLQDCPDWRGENRPFRVLLSSPAIWEAGQLVAAPFAGRPGNCEIKLTIGRDRVIETLLSH